MHIIDVVAVCTAVAVFLFCVAVLARQRYMLQVTGAVPLAVQRGNRWLYGIARYQGGELRWYRALGIGTRPSQVLRRGDIKVLGHRERLESERSTLPVGAVIVDLRAGDDRISVALGDSAYTGFVSWLESSAPRF